MSINVEENICNCGGIAEKKLLDSNGISIILSAVDSRINGIDENIKKITDIEDSIDDINTRIDSSVDDINTIKNNTPIVKGDAENSAVLKGEYQDYSNKAISRTSMAVGAASTAGLKGWYYTHVDIDNKKIYLSTSQYTFTFFGTKVGCISNKGGKVDASFVSGYEVGDVISIVYDQKFEDYATIEAINGNEITLDKVPFTSSDFNSLGVNIDTSNISKIVVLPDDYSVYCIKRYFDDTTKVLTVTKHDNGGVDFGGASHAEGVQTYALNIGAHAEGGQTIAKGQYSHAEGLRTQAGYVAHAEGKGGEASGDASHVEGIDTTASGGASHAEGDATRAEGSRAHAEGSGTWAYGRQGHAEGYITTAFGLNSHAENRGTIAFGDKSHAEGESSVSYSDLTDTQKADLKTAWRANKRFSIAFGENSHVEGTNNFAGSKSTHAEGENNIVTGQRGHAEGRGNEVSAANGHAEGSYNKVGGASAHAEGTQNITNNIAEHASGKYNVSIPKTADNTTADATQFSIGIGTSDTDRKNAFEVKQNGDIYINGLTLPLAKLLSADTDEDVDSVWNDVLNSNF